MTDGWRFGEAFLSGASSRVLIPETLAYALLRRYHSQARRTFVTTQHQRRDLEAHEAYPVTGPIDVVRVGVAGVLDEDLRKATPAALALDREGCRREASGWTWARASAQFLGNLVYARDGRDLVVKGPSAAQAAS